MGEARRDHAGAGREADLRERVQATRFRWDSDEARRKKWKDEPSWACAAVATFSSAVKPGRTWVIWKERVRPRSARWWMGRRVMSSPQKVMVPASSATSPVISPISVVLPAPFGPMMAWSSPGRTSRLTPSVTLRAP